MQEYADKRHQEVLEMIAALSDTTSSDRASTVGTFYGFGAIRQITFTFVQISRIYSSSNNRSVLWQGY
jgi:hypothetical protein